MVYKVRFVLPRLGKSTEIVLAGPSTPTRQPRHVGLHGQVQSAHLPQGNEIPLDEELLHSLLMQMISVNLQALHQLHGIL
jgi:hypothetical protein